ncbi:MAG: nucleoside phosphorylase [Clostridiales bacterium]|nr:nucleoside phosphorylase [Clostridiales bacterium]
MGIVDTFDNTTEEILKPSCITGMIDGFPETVIAVFNQKTINVLLRLCETEIVSSMYAGDEVPVYKTFYKGKPIAFFLAWLGGPATVGMLEEIIAKGGKKILLFGSCGSLESSITDGHVVVPTAAYRDEGTSYHYAPAGTGDFIEVKTAGRLVEVLSELKVPFICGKTWTTDGLYRETRKNMGLRKKAGCITVDMECASAMAMANFRNVEAYQFLYTEDNLDCAEWEPRLLGNLPDSFRERYVRIALEVAIRI